MNWALSNEVERNQLNESEASGIVNELQRAQHLGYSPEHKEFLNRNYERLTNPVSGVIDEERKKASEAINISAMAKITYDQAQAFHGELMAKESWALDDYTTFGSMLDNEKYWTSLKNDPEKMNAVAAKFSETFIAEAKKELEAEAVQKGFGSVRTEEYVHENLPERAHEKRVETQKAAGNSGVAKERGKEMLDLDLEQKGYRKDMNNEKTVAEMLKPVTDLAGQEGAASVAQVKEVNEGYERGKASASFEELGKLEDVKVVAQSNLQNIIYDAAAEKGLDNFKSDYEESKDSKYMSDDDLFESMIADAAKPLQKAGMQEEKVVEVSKVSAEESVAKAAEPLKKADVESDKAAPSPVETAIADNGQAKSAGSPSLA